jgi:hypothetical protein
MEPTNKNFIAPLAILVLGLILVAVAFIDLKDEQLTAPGTDTGSCVSDTDVNCERWKIGYDPKEKRVIEIRPGDAFTETITIQEVPDSTNVMSQRTSPDGKYIYYTVVTGAYYSTPPEGGQNASVSVAFRYEIETGKIEALFTSAELAYIEKVWGPYIFVHDVSADGSRALFNANQCWECDAPPGGKFMFRAGGTRYFPENTQYVGHAGDFKFTGPDTYSYVERFEVDCPDTGDDFGWPCYAGTEIKTGTF